MRMTLPSPNPRRGAAALGLGVLAFGVLPLVLPRQFARLFGFPELTGSTASVFRSVGAREVVMGMGLWSASAHGGNYAPWLLARLLVDGGDTLAIGLAAGGNQTGARHPRFLALGAVALGATVVDGALYWLARQAGADDGTQSEGASDFATQPAPDTLMSDR